MEINCLKWSKAVQFGFLIVLTELTFTLTSFLFWPTDSSGGFNISKNWHSDLGSIRNGFNSITGAFIYNSGQIIQGIAFIFFSYEIYNYFGEKNEKNFLVQLSQVFGYFIGVSIFMNGIFTIDYKILHSIWSFSIFIGIAPFIGILSYFFLPYRGFKRLLGLYGFFVILLDIVFLIFTNLIEIVIVEYLLIGSGQLFILLVTQIILYEEVILKKSNSKSMLEI